MEVKTHQAIKREVGITGTLIRFMEAAIQTQHHPHRMFGHRFWRIGWHSDDLHSKSLRRFKVDFIKASTTHGNKTSSPLVKLF
ncbi:Uncharacterised protein [Vibrio cholerae]|uniref:Uncharacterized protein n=1 Tax=Vibrio cholerae TaxID=666 RepID=A0A655QFI9_VIBCL|nr:Uncharacterised protein [Vibrio cholerae]CSC02624.1 Uncharacterised protein [Vibrio cholerae]CSD04394.1 Uncharacterised protein [Vibrio cholerae]